MHGSADPDPHQNVMDPENFVKVQAVFQIRFQSGQWIWIRIRNPNLDPGGQTDPQVENRVADPQ